MNSEEGEREEGENWRRREEKDAVEKREDRERERGG